MKALRHVAPYLPLIVIVMIIALSFWKQEYHRDTASTDLPPDLTLLVVLDRLRMADIAGIQNLTSKQAFDTIKGVCHNPHFAKMRLHSLAVKRGLTGTQLNDAQLVWQKWAEAMDDNEIKWQRESDDGTKAYPLFQKEHSVSFELEQQRDGTWLVTEVTLATI